MEGNYEKVDRLLEIRENAAARLAVADKEIEQERTVSLQLCSHPLTNRKCWLGFDRGWSCSWGK